MDYLNFSDMCVKYSTFLDDVAARVVHLLKQDARPGVHQPEQSI